MLHTHLCFNSAEFQPGISESWVACTRRCHRECVATRTD